MSAVDPAPAEPQGLKRYGFAQAQVRSTITRGIVYKCGLCGDDIVHTGNGKVHQNCRYVRDNLGEAAAKNYLTKLSLKRVLEERACDKRQPQDDTGHDKPESSQNSAVGLHTLPGATHGCDTKVSRDMPPKHRRITIDTAQAEGAARTGITVEKGGAPVFEPAAVQKYLDEVDWILSTPHDIEDSVDFGADESSQLPEYHETQDPP